MQNKNDLSIIGMQIGTTSDGRLVIELPGCKIETHAADEWQPYEPFYVRASKISQSASKDTIFVSARGETLVGDLIMMYVPAYCGLWMIEEVGVKYSGYAPKLTGRRVMTEALDGAINS